MNHPLVSIIIPIYKVEAYLRRCLNSVINQTYTNLEIILVDDGSPDNCPQICDDYTHKDHRIVVIHKKNGGLSDARNAGLDVCKGKFISFVDSDDWLDEKYIEVLLNLADKNNADITIGEHEKICNDKPFFIENKKEKSLALSTQDALIILFKRNHLSFILSWGKLYRKSLFDEIRFPEGKFHEDEFTTYLIFQNAAKIVYTPQVLYYYFQRVGSTMGTPHPRDLLEAEEAQFIFILQNNMEAVKGDQAKLICWQILYIYSKEPSKKLKEKLLYYTKFLKAHRNPFVHYFLLKIFCRHPRLYSIIRKLSPFHISK